MNTYTKVACLLAATFVISVVNGASGPEPLQEIADHKDFKKILRTKTNVMVLFVESVKAARPLINTCQEVAEKVKGTGSIFLVNCGSEGKKLCKKLKVAPEPSVLKHYKDGDFHKDYDRKENVQSLSNFMRDPTGDIPWEEESNTEDIVHLADPVSLTKFLKPTMKPMLLMAYAPWCKFCKILKPEYAAAAKELKNTAVLAAMDVTRAENSIVSKYLNVTGFPTLIYFEGGEAKHRYEGENTKDGIVAFVKNPVAAPPKAAEQDWSDVSKDVVHLGVEDFDQVLEGQNSALVMFYAPWCGHCKRMKPELDSAAKTMKEEGIDGILAAVDVTKHRSLGERYGVTGYPTLKFFKKGEVAFEAGNVPDVRKSAGIVAFMKDPQEPPPPPPPEKAWSESDGNVVHLTEESFKGFLKKKKHVLVMFYAPWCGHCKAMKPAFEEAAGKFVDNPKVEYAAVDCTQHGKICNQYGVSGYPTVKYFSYFDKDEKNYHEGRTVESFVNYMNDLLGVPRSGEPAKKAPPKDDFDWASVPGGSDVKVLTEDNFEDELKASGNTLVMYFAPWCGHCKAMKADYAAAAAELKSKGVSKVSLAAVDCTQERSLMNKAEVRGFPTLKFYKGTEIAFEYDGERTKEALVSFALDPKPKQQKKAPVEDGNNGFDWASLPGGEDVKVLTEGNFKETLEGLDGALVMFYAPWCGHCKSMKEAFASAAKTVKAKSGSKQIALAAVDCTVERSLVQDHGIRGFPTLKYFKKGTFALDYKGPRSEDALASFALDPEKAKDEEKLKEKKMADEFDWKSIPGGEAVLTLTNQNFEKLKQVEGALVMYYAPWCGHCKSMKADYAEAAGSLEKLGLNNFKLAAVDCTVEQDLAEKAGIRSFPTLKYYVKGEYISDYRRGRKKDDLVSFAKNPPQPDSKQEEFWKGVSGEEAVLKLNGQDFFPELKKHEGALVMFYSPGCRRCEEAKSEFAQAANDLKLNEINTYVFASVDTEVSGELAKLTLSGTRVPPPNFLYFHHGEHLKDYSGPARRKDFVEFALGTGEKTGKKEDSSQEDSAEKAEEFKWNAFPGGKDVKVLNGDNYQEELKKYDAAVVFFRAPGCRHCRAMQRDYAFAAQMLTEKRAANVVLATVDGQEEPDLIKRLGVEGYPTLWVYRKGVHVGDHHGDRTYQKFVEVVLEEAGKMEKEAKEEL